MTYSSSGNGLFVVNSLGLLLLLYFAYTHVYPTITNQQITQNEQSQQSPNPSSRVSVFPMMYICYNTYKYTHNILFILLVHESLRMNSNVKFQYTTQLITCL